MDSAAGLMVSDRAHVVMPYHKAEDGLREEELLKRGEIGERVGASGLMAGEIGTTRQRDRAVRMPRRQIGRRRVRDGRSHSSPDVLQGQARGGVPASSRRLLGGLAALGRAWTRRADRPEGAASKQLIRVGRTSSRASDPATSALPDARRDGREGPDGCCSKAPMRRCWMWTMGRTRIVTAVPTRACSDRDSGGGWSRPQASDGAGDRRAEGLLDAGWAAGPMPTELDRCGRRAASASGGKEYGTTTGPTLDGCGWLDLVAARYAVRCSTA